MLDSDAREFLLKQRLGYVATVSEDGTPNLSPKGTIFVWDDNHLVFANIRSPQTVKNIASNPSVEINVVDPISRRGYRFRGTAQVTDRGDVYEKAVCFYRNLGIQSRIIQVVMIRVTYKGMVTSPLYDTGLDSEQISAIWRRRLLG